MHIHCTPHNNTVLLTARAHTNLQVNISAHSEYSTAVIAQHTLAVQSHNWSRPLNKSSYTRWYTGHGGRLGNPTPLVKPTHPHNGLVDGLQYILLSVTVAELLAHSARFHALLPEEWMEPWCPSAGLSRNSGLLSLLTHSNVELV